MIIFVIARTLEVNISFKKNQFTVSLMISLKEVIEKMAGDRPIFHSEGDFQYSLAKNIEICSPDSVVRLEYPRRLLPKGKSGSIDIWWDNRNPTLCSF